MSITKKLIFWYSDNKRSLPWRANRDPYSIWLSEIILQQTRIDQGKAYYERFIKEFRNVQELADASEEKILRLWQGLGYYSRARNLHAAAKQIMKEFNGHFPSTYDDIQKLKGVGEYTAGAIASIAFSQAVPAVDGNVKRVISRLYNIREDISKPGTHRQIKQICNELMDKEDPGTFNQALMEFGALMCTPKNPACENCPLTDHCLALDKNVVHELPVKYKKQKIKNRYFYYLHVEYETADTTFTFLEQRTRKDIWQKLFQFPLIESDKILPEGELPVAVHDLIPKDFVSHICISNVYKHVLSHQHIFARFVRLKLTSPPEKLPGSAIAVAHEKIDDYAIPRLIERYLEKLS